MGDSTDYAEMEATIRELNDRASCLAELPCPDLSCTGTFTRSDGEYWCRQCGTHIDDAFDDASILR